MGHASFSFTRDALRELDRRAVEEFHIPILVLMENAGRAAADSAARMLKKSGGSKVLILAGPGNNGGDGLVAARHLHNAGVEVAVLLIAERGQFKDAAATQLAIVEAMKLPVETVSRGHAELRDWLVESSPNDLLIDAIFGTGLSRAVEGLAAEVIAAANAGQRQILAVDIPSGLDCDSGEPAGGGAVVRAAETISFCGTKPGFARARGYTGKVTVADIGAPHALLDALALKTR
ncbi:MAG TPA: NAD(P)H-hydrate epimerase [Phycisphaerae bacterium]|nr:NAD(P)H-hydrate epimerase [Phycisphaerae bacterium]